MEEDSKYDDPQLPLTATDLSRLRGEAIRRAWQEEDGGGLGVYMPAPTYATMCLRELTKQVRS